MEIEKLLAQARRLELKTGFLARSHYAGLYRSAFRGQGMEFAEVREYSEGDDVRLIDWNVSARSQTLYVKRMVEERERQVLLLLDTSGSLSFGSRNRSKFDLLTELAALLAISGFYARDRMSLALFSERVDLFIPAAKGWNHAARLIREMVSRQPQGWARDLEPVWNFLVSPGIPRSLVLMLSDFQAPFRPSNALAAGCRKHELVLLLLSDPREWDLPPVGRIRLEDPESGRSRVVNTNSGELRRSYREAGLRKRADLEQLLRANGADWVELSTAHAYEGTLRRFLEARSVRRGCRRP